ncbi:MAG: helix-turn-helix transcriptional regulator [Candidatus Bathyarchaeota archaeon]|nr:helix-turn-helix transcriptional regulator [Candidatus Bathyarchaeota archaeon]
MTKRRSRTDLVYEVLESIDSGIHKPTHILYNTKVSWNVYTEIIDMLQTKNFIKTVSSKESSTRNRVQYYLTDNGREALQGMQFLKDVFSPA